MGKSKLVNTMYVIAKHNKGHIPWINHSHNGDNDPHFQLLIKDLREDVQKRLAAAESDGDYNTTNSVSSDTTSETSSSELRTVSARVDKSETRPRHLVKARLPSTLIRVPTSGSVEEQPVDPSRNGVSPV